MTFLLLNYYDGGFITYVFSEDISLRILHEVTKRFRAAGWGTFVSPTTDADGHRRYNLPMITFWKRDPTGPADISERVEKLLTTM